MKKLMIAAAALVAGFLATAPASAFCVLNCEPKPADARKVFENLV